MFDRPLQLMKERWWGLIVAFLLILFSVYCFIWAIVEPLGVPDTFQNLPDFVKLRAFLHIVLTLLISAYLTLILELVIRRRNKNIYKPTDAGDSTTQQLTSQIDREKNRTKEIHEKLNERLEELKAIQRIVSDRDDSVSLEINKVLARVSKYLDEEQLSMKELATASEWVNQRAIVWSSDIRQSEIQDKKLSDKHLQILREEIRQHIQLLSQNLINGTFGSPRKHKIPQTLGSSLIYKRALISVKERMERELEDPTTQQLIGGSKVCQELKTYMDALIDDT